ncbi:hypothetical protein CAPTEDRAFT_222668 [Capitella teleta]|uniref:Poly [ADP-ribose] polymerase n=1 Tax=Capitella teleta TaxID=283909 RepID=R7TPS2_CAPTE|nr:hypothetical protein CAPTEDRAFT_222668 [Capitella teleta]|eukprot:ELT95659.1 hypothetical protein CAPTEDRAFT_222668 [Capitella teleta]
MAIKLCNVPCSMTAEMLEELLENWHGRPLSPGTYISIDEETHEAIVTFGDAAEADTMAGYQTIDFKDVTMMVEKLSLPTASELAEVVSIVDYVDDHDEATEFTTLSQNYKRKIVVSGVGELDEDRMRLMFANKNKCGGGPIESITFDKISGTALIVYEEESDASNVLENEEIVIFGHVLRISRPVVQGETQMKKKLVGIPHGAVKGDIELPMKHTETQKLNQLREFVMVTLPCSTCMLQTRFNTTCLENAIVAAADNIQKCKQLKRKGCAIKAEYIQEEVVAPETTSFQSRVISVTNLSKDDHVTSVKLLFENQRRSGGGPVESFEYVEEGYHVITFTSPTDALNIYEYSLSEGIQWNGRPLNIHLLEPLQGNARSHAITVDNLDPASMSEEILNLYFEDARSSNGGPVRSIVVREGGRSAVVCFSDQADAKNVVRKQSHVLNGIALHVASLRPRPPPRLIKNPVEDNTLFLWGIPCSADVETIRMFVEEAAGCTVSRISFGVEPGKALLLFDNQPNYPALRRQCTRYPMLGQMVQVERVPQSRSIQVSGFSTSLQILELYFECNNRSSGEEVESTRKYNEYAIITFKDKNTLDRILSRDHVLEEHKLVIRKYFDCLGVLPVDHDDSLPGEPMPNDIIIKIEDEAVLKFLLQTTNMRQAAEVNLRAAECQISWPNRTSEPLILKCTLNRNTDGFYRASKEWEDNVNQRIHSMLSELTSEKFTVVSKIWQKFSTKIDEVIQNQDSQKLSITLSKSDSLCSITGKKTHVKEVSEELKEMVEMLMMEDAFMKRKISDKVLLKEHWQKLILLGPELDKVKSKYPELSIDFTPPKSDTLSFEGRYGEIQEAKEHVLSVLRNIPRKVMTAKATTNILLSLPGMKQPILRRMNGRRLVWDPSVHVAAVVIYTLDEGDLEIGINSIREVIKEHILNFRSAKEQMLMKALTDLEMKFKGRISYEIHDNLLELSVSWDAEHRVMTKINDIVQDPAKKQTFSVNLGIVRLLKAHMTEKLNGICKQFHSSDCRYGFDDVSGITLTCVESQFDTFHAAFMDVINVVYNAEAKFKEPGFGKFLSTQKGRDRMKALEHRHHICIHINGKSGGTTEASTEHSAVESDAAMLEAAPCTVQAGNCTISVHCGSILQCKADVLVSAANKKLDHVRGIAKAIIDEGGEEIQEECRKHVAENGEIEVAEVYVSKPGQLRTYKHIMHAVGPEWKGGDDKEDELLGKCITNILREAEKKKAKSIAIPAISTGTYGYPIRKATDVIVTAIKDYNSNTIDEILLVDIREEAVNSFCHALSEAFHQDVPIPVTAGRRRDYEPDRPTLSVYAATENDMKAAIADIKTMVHEECMKEHVNSDRDKNAIANLDAVQLDGILELQRRHDVQINTKDADTKGITIEGLTRDVAVAKNSILEIIRETEHRIRDCEEGRLLSNQVKWQYLPTGKETFLDYPDDLNALIEKAHAKSLGSVQFKSNKGDVFTIKFDDMIESKHGCNEEQKVKRLSKEYGPQVPELWSPMSGSDPYYCFDLSPNSAEYQKVAHNFASTGGCNIVKIQRVQNKTLYLQYQVYKNERDQVNGILQNEKLLWHGTSHDTVKKICAQGFNRNYCGKNATAYGAGSYFAVNASYSMQHSYSPPSPYGLRYIFQARVVTGQSTKGHSRLRDPPPKNPARPDILFDSVCDQPFQPSMFVVFSDPVAYPEYIVVFR